MVDSNASVAATDGEGGGLFGDSVTAQGVLTLMASLAVGLLGLTVVYGYGNGGSKAASRPRWFSLKAGKRWTEQHFLVLSAGWITFFGGIVATGVYHTMSKWAYIGTGLVVALPFTFVPLLASDTQGEPAGTPLLDRYWVKANVWIAIMAFVGNYFWTHYFYNLLGVKYEFPDPLHRINNVPVPMFLITHGYFLFYHTGTTLVLRRWWTSITYVSMPRGLQVAASAAVVLLMAWFTAVMEAFTISAVPYYNYPSAEYMYTVGAVCYGIYFIVSFPMFYRLDEGRGRWTLAQAAIDALAACMLVTILLDLWRLAVGGVLPDTPNCVPWM